MRSRVVVCVLVAGVAIGLAGSQRGDATPARAVAGELTASEVQALLSAHNALRAKYGTPALVWDAKLAAFAQQWANTRAKTGAVHQANNRYGENTYWSGGTPRTSNYVVGDWASEVKNYNLASNKCKATKDCSHFTQIVWKTTKKFGCARASGNVPPAGVSWKGENFYWVCESSPRGNFIGRNFKTG